MIFFFFSRFPVIRNKIREIAPFETQSTILIKSNSFFFKLGAFENEDVTHIDGEVDPVRDIGTINEELRLKDIQALQSPYEKIEKLVARGEKKYKTELEVLEKLMKLLRDEKKHVRFAEWNAIEIEYLNNYLLLTSKPQIYLVNLSEKDYIRKKNKW